MKAYLDLLDRILTEGTDKSNRTGTGTRFLPNLFFSHDMAKGFPLLTSKRVPMKIVAVELEGFIKGVTDKRWFQERGCHIWDSWCNPITAENSYNEDSGVTWEDHCKSIDDLGPIYGHQWTKFGKATDETMRSFDYDTYLIEEDHVRSGANQLQYVIDTLKTNPNDRRMVVSAWNPNSIDEMALPPCHYTFCVTHCNGVVNLHWTQRSADFFLGVPFNIASYGLLLELICKETDMIPGNLSGTFCDAHIYDDHIDQCKEQLSRDIRILPSVEISGKEDFDIFSWTHKDMIMVGYDPHPTIKGSVSI